MPAPHLILSYVVKVCLSGSETAGAFSIAEYLKPPGDWTPLHAHHRESQTTYVMEGEVTIHLPDGPHVLGPGRCLFQPLGVPHTEEITSDTPARVLDIYAPPGFERWVTLAGEPTDEMALPARPETPDERRLSELLAITKQLGIEMLGGPGELPY